TGADLRRSETTNSAAVWAGSSESGNGNTPTSQTPGPTMERRAPRLIFFMCGFRRGEGEGDSPGSVDRVHAAREVLADDDRLARLDLDRQIAALVAAAKRHGARAGGEGHPRVERDRRDEAGVDAVDHDLPPVRARLYGHPADVFGRVGRGDDRHAR